MQEREMSDSEITEAEVLKVVREQLLMIMELEPDEIEIEMESRFQDELELESIEMIALGDAVKIYYSAIDVDGAQLDVDFAAWLSQLSIEQLMELSVGDLVRWLHSSLNPE